jgi:glutathione S-transferase
VTTEALELIQFPHSHYNEKVRWALAWKALPYTRRDLLPGPHAPTVLWLTGQTQTPVMRFGAEVVAGSARIIDELERRHPEPALLPADPALRRRVLELQAWADADVGPMVRRSLFAVLLDHPDYVVRIFAREHSATVQTIYRALFPVTKLVMSTSMGTRAAASVAQGDAATQAALDRVAREVGPSGHLAGDAFSLADLAVASLLAPAVRVEHPAMRLPDPVPEPVATWYRRWESHPAASWVQETYRRHRPADA